MVYYTLESVFEVQNLAEQDESAKGKALDLSAHTREMEERERALKADNAVCDTFIHEQRESREGALEELTEAKVALSKAEERETSLLDRKTPMEQRLGELQRIEFALPCGDGHFAITQFVPGVLQAGLQFSLFS